MPGVTDLFKTLQSTLSTQYQLQAPYGATPKPQELVPCPSKLISGYTSPPPSHLTSQLIPATGPRHRLFQWALPICFMALYLVASYDSGISVNVSPGRRFLPTQSQVTLETP